MIASSRTRVEVGTAMRFIPTPLGMVYYLILMILIDKTNKKSNMRRSYSRDIEIELSLVWNENINIWLFFVVVVVVNMEKN